MRGGAGGCPAASKEGTYLLICSVRAATHALRSSTLLHTTQKLLSGLLIRKLQDGQRKPMTDV